MNYDAVIFDIDGTLWNATEANAKGWNLGLEALGMSRRVTAEQIASVSGNPYEQCIDMLLPGERIHYPELSSVFAAHEEQVVAADGGKLYDGVADGIIRLARDFKIFLVSNCSDWYISLFIQFSQLGPALSGVDCHGKSGLPKEEMIRRVVRENRLRNPVYVGDTSFDEIAATKAGIEFFHAAWGFGTSSAAAKSFSTFASLVDFLLESKPAWHTEKD
jgi:phosphoglycolate phosphatase